MTNTYPFLSHEHRDEFRDYYGIEDYKYLAKIIPMLIDAFKKEIELISVVKYPEGQKVLFLRFKDTHLYTDDFLLGVLALLEQLANVHGRFIAVNDSDGDISGMVWYAI